MALSQAYLAWEQATEQRGERRLVESLLQARFGELDQQLMAIVPQILALPREKCANLILQLSHEELLEQFSSVGTEPERDQV
jgi:hypothetical protein